MIVAAPAKVCNRRVTSLVLFWTLWTRDPLRHDGDVAHSGRTEHSAVALHFGERAERLGVIIGKLHGRAAVRTRHFADQTDGIESAAALRIAAAEIVGQQRAPAGAEANTPTGDPLAAIDKIGRGAEIGGCRTVHQYATKVGMQAQYVVDIERVGSDDEFARRVSTVRLQPGDIFVPGRIGTFAVDALSGPIGRPFRCAL